VAEKYPRNIFDRADIEIRIYNKTQWQFRHVEIIGFTAKKNVSQTS